MEKSWKKKVISTNNKKNNRGELSAGTRIRYLWHQAGSGETIFMFIIISVPSETDGHVAIHHVRHLTVQSVFGALDLGYSTRWQLGIGRERERQWGRRAGRVYPQANEFSAEGELTVSG